MSEAGSFYAVAPSYYQTSSTVEVVSENCNGLTKPATGLLDPNCYGCNVTTIITPETTTPGTTSSDCNFPVNKATDASGTGCYGCAITTTYGSTSYSCGSGITYNYSSQFIADLNCHGCGSSNTSYVNKTCTGGPAEYPDGTLSTACGGKCSCTGPLTRTTYGCTGTTQNYSTLAACNASSTTSTYNASTVGTRCGSCSQPIAGVNLFRAPAVAATNTTYYTCNTNVCTNVTQFSCTYSTATTADTYTCRGRDTSTPPITTPASTTYSCTGQQVTNNVTTNTYYTQLRIMSTGYTSYVAVLKDQNINTNTSEFQKVKKISVTTSGNNISATAYSDSGSSLGTATYTRSDAQAPLPDGTHRSDLAKPAAGAASYAGVIKTPSQIRSDSISNNAGDTYENLSIS